jgi:hypothetical protein
VVEGVGEIAAYRNHEFIGRLRQDVLIVNEMDVLQAGPAHEKLLTAIRGFKSRIKSMVGRKRYDEFGSDTLAENEWITALSRVLMGIQRYGHGGAVLLSNGSKGLAPRYSLEYPRLTEALDRVSANELLDSLFTSSIYCDYVAHTEVDDKVEVPAILLIDQNLAREHVKESRNELKGCVQFLSSLARVDGLIWLKHNLSLKGFGVIIESKGKPGPAFRAENTAGTKKRPIDFSHLGTRHSSMIRQCARNPKSVGFVISQDGDVRAITKVGTHVLMWENIRLQRLTNVKASKGPASMIRMIAANSTIRTRVTVEGGEANQGPASGN